MVAGNIDVVLYSEAKEFKKFVVDSFYEDTEINIIGTAGSLFDIKRYALARKDFVIVFQADALQFKTQQSALEYFKEQKINWIIVCDDLQIGYEAIKYGAMSLVLWRGEMATNRTEQQHLIRNLRMKIRATIKTNEVAIKETTKIELVNYSEYITKMIVIASSTGGTEALMEVLKRLKADVPPILIVQHMPAGFTKNYAERLDEVCPMKVIEASNGDVVRNGIAMLAPGDFHIEIQRSGMGYRIKTYKGEKVNGVAPAADVLFESVARLGVKNVIGVILTGMGNDGARGLLELKKKGSYNIGQNMESCVVYGMPKAAYDMGAIDIQADLPGIASLLMERI